MGDGVYTIENALIIVAGLAVIVGGVLLVRHRRVLRDFFARTNREMYGERMGERMARVPPWWAVGAPGAVGIFIGTVFVIGGAFDWFG